MTDGQGKVVATYFPETDEFVWHVSPASLWLGNKHLFSYLIVPPPNIPFIVRLATWEETRAVPFEEPAICDCRLVETRPTYGLSESRHELQLKLIRSISTLTAYFY